jgi:uncharacterized RDD family membrane protein YckC
MSYAWILPLAYFLFKDAFTGQSVGKMIVGIRVTNDQNQEVDPIQGMIRNVSLASCTVLTLINQWLGLAIILILLVEYFSMTADKNGQRMGDKIGQTKVQDLRPNIGDGVFLLISIVLMIMLIGYYVTIASKYGKNTISGKTEGIYEPRR